jgi:N-acetylmuramoyl-L-alanine amidase
VHGGAAITQAFFRPARLLGAALLPLARLRNLALFALAAWAGLSLAGSAMAQGGQAGIAVRVGYGADATRVVVDSPIPVTSRREDADADKMDLMLRGPDAGIALEGSGHGLVRAWRLDAGEGGSRLTLYLNGASRIVRTFLIPPGGESSMYRYVIDLARADQAVAMAAAKPETTVKPTPPAAVATVATFETFAPRAKSAAISAQPVRIARPKEEVEVVAVSRTPRRTARLVREPIDQPVLAVAEPVRPAATVIAERERRPHPAHDERKVIVIDAGHGGHDPGAQSEGESEKDITLAAAFQLRHRLLRDGRYRVVMTRSSDTFVPLEDRVRIARRAGADLFIALHADSAGDNDATHGASVYTLSGHGETRVNEVLTSHEWFNRPRSDPAVKGILLDLTQRSTLNRSNEFAQLLVGRLSEKIDVLPKTHRDAGYFVLLAPDVPAVLLEMGFITSPQDADRLTDPAQRRALMDMVGDAIDDYFRGDVRVAQS